MSTPIELPQYSLAEELANAISHGIGAFLSIAGLATLVAFAALYGDVWHITSCAIFGSTMVILYTASTLYHSVTHERIRCVLQQLDHAAIYLLIAGTYTPFLLVNLRGNWGWTLFGIIWGVAIVGMVLVFTCQKRSEKISLALYLCMGWLALVAIKPFISNIELGGLGLILAGGMFYTLGVFFYVADRIPFNHAIWHGFVMLGTGAHFFAVLYYVIPSASMA